MQRRGAARICWERAGRWFEGFIIELFWMSCARGDVLIRCAHSVARGHEKGHTHLSECEMRKKGRFIWGS